MRAVPPSPLRVLVVARRPVARAGLRGILAEREDLRIVGQGAGPDDVGHLASERGADVVLADWDVVEVAALAEVAATAGVPVVLLGEAPTPGELRAAMLAGVRGFLLPDATADEVGAALHAARQGLLALHPALGRALAAGETAATPEQVGDHEQLTEREREVLHLLALGLANKTIASRLGIGERTVKFHVGSLLAKLGASSRTEVVTLAIRRGLLTL